MRLRNFYEQYKATEIYPLHMPGHKRNREFVDIFDDGILNLDITEIPGADNLLEPSGALKELQSRLSELYSADESYLLINGASCGIIAAIMAVCTEGDTVIVGRNSHRSVFSGLILSGANPVYVCPPVDKNGFCLGIKADAIGSALANNKQAKAVVITSPTYEGVCSDVQEIARVVHSYGALLIVDEAHGAHFGFHDYFPQSSVRLGADIVIHSLHKTMPVLTQTAALHVKTGYINLITKHKLAEALAMTQSSSPSYILMSAAELFIDKFFENGQKYFENFVELLYPLRKELKVARSLKLIEPGSIYDKSKLLMLTGEIHDGSFLSELLRNKYGLEMEMFGKGHVLAMTSVADTKEGLDRLLNGVRSMDIELNPYVESLSTRNYVCGSINVINPRKAFQAYEKNEVFDYRYAEGMISSGFAVPYPPGVPLLAPGELITPEIIEAITDCLERGVTISGADSSTLCLHCLTI